MIYLLPTLSPARTRDSETRRRSRHGSIHFSNGQQKFLHLSARGVPRNLLAILVGWKASIRAMEAAERRQQRDAQKRFRELERQAKEHAKLSAIEQGRLEVETYESGVAVLLSVHKDQSEVWDWKEPAMALPPHSPRKLSHRELKAKQRAEHQGIEEARVRDEQEFQEALQAHAAERAEWERMRVIALRILAGDHKAYTEALVEFSALAEISELGSSLHFTVHSADMVECGLKVNGRQAIPTELKTLTSTGKVSVKPMPKARFHEIYQDYVCGCVLRVAREVFALLPVETVLVTASVDALDSRTGQTVEQPVLSAAMDRNALRQLDFEHVDPSDAMENFLHRGDFKASRKSGEFESIAPLTPADLPQIPSESMDFYDVLAVLRRVRDEVRAEMRNLDPQSTATTSTATRSS